MFFIKQIILQCFEHFKYDFCFIVLWIIPFNLIVFEFKFSVLSLLTDYKKKKEVVIRQFENIMKALKSIKHQWISIMSQISNNIFLIEKNPLLTGSHFDIFILGICSLVFLLKFMDDYWFSLEYLAKNYLQFFLFF